MATAYGPLRMKIRCQLVNSFDKNQEASIMLQKWQAPSNLTDKHTQGEEMVW